MGMLVINIFVCWQGHTQSMRHRLAAVFQPAKCEQTITHQHMLLKRESLIDGTAITILLC